MLTLEGVIGQELLLPEHGLPCITWARRTLNIYRCFHSSEVSSISGYLESCRSIVTCARNIADSIASSIPELYVLGSPPASVVAFASKHPKVNVLEVGDAMAQRGWHLNALSNPPAVHIACTVSEIYFWGSVASDPCFYRSA